MAVFAPSVTLGSKVSSVTGASSTTTSTSYGNLVDGTTTSVTVNIGPSGLALVAMTATGAQNGANENLISFSVSGNTTIAFNDNSAAIAGYGAGGLEGNTQLTWVAVVSSLVSGSNTFTLGYRVTGGTGTFVYRYISVVPL